MHCITIMVDRFAAIVFAALVSAGALFQLLLAARAPWGEITMGGKFPGRLPAPLRAAAVAQAAVLLALGAGVLAHEGLAFPSAAGWSAYGAWVAVVVSAVSLLLNITTPSRRERLIWAPVALGMLISSAIVAFEP